MAQNLKILQFGSKRAKNSICLAIEKWVYKNALTFHLMSEKIKEC